MPGLECAKHSKSGSGGKPVRNRLVNHDWDKCFFSAAALSPILDWGSVTCKNAGVVDYSFESGLGIARRIGSSFYSGMSFESALAWPSSSAGHRLRLR